MCVVITNECFSSGVYFFSVSMNSPFELLCLVNTSIKGHAKKKKKKIALERVPFPFR